VARRSALFSAIAEVFGFAPDELGPALENPFLRGRLSTLMTGVETALGTTDPVDALVSDAGLVSVGSARLRVLSDDRGAQAVRPALDIWEAALGRHGVSGRLQLMDATSERWASAFELLVAGVELLAGVAPTFVGDLLPHVALVAILDGDLVERLGSASAREFPGLVALPPPRTPLEAAEALVHEGAHQKFFDLAMTSSVLSARAYRPMGVVPSWSPSDAPPWSVEQTFAAFHAYSCLASLAEVSASGACGRRHPHSLLPVASRRAAELGAWLGGHPELLGRDGRRLVAALGARVGPACPEPPQDAVQSGLPSVTRCVGDWSVVVQAGVEPAAWVTTASSAR